MSKDTIALINGHEYKYRWNGSEMDYLGPVGDAPSLTESQFREAMENKTPLERYFNVSALENQVQRSLQEVINNFEQFEGEEGQAEYWLMDIGSSSAGIYQPRDIISAYNLEGDAKDYLEYDQEPGVYRPEVWDEVIEPFFDGITEEMNERVKVQVPKGYDYSLAFGHHPGDGSYGLFLIVEQT
jgi:hypothetical protein